MPQPRLPALLAPVPRTSTAVLLAKVAAWRGLDVVAVPPERGERDLHWYGGPLAAARVTGRLGVGLLEPHDDWLSTLPYELTRRRIELTTLAEAWQLQAPAFVKPPSDKSVPAAVYADGTRLPKDGDRIGPETPVLVSEVVEFAAEYRLFVLDGQVRTGSRYAVHGRLDPAPLDPAARDFAGELLRQSAHTLPSAVVVDTGRLDDGRWAVVEANMPWFAQSYAAEPGHVLDVVLRASGPRARISAHDRAFLR
ncbi:ATP-grasp domain-containing protein [Streptomyces sp. NPDC060064]|uniref:ATP-grasp domain-containing protein n=1 Tax=Streptomyces sp. NPDC060064 TaxID=3347049 RepID=UPI00368EC1E1